MSRFNPQVTYYRRDKMAEVFFSVFIAGLFFPKRLFKGMPEAGSLKQSAHLLTLYLLTPTLMMTLTAGTGIPFIAPGFWSGLFAILLILPVSISIGVASSLLWAWYLSRASKWIAGYTLTIETAFQICAYSGPPFVIAWGPYLGPVMALWNMLLNWKGLVHHGGLSWWTSLLIIITGLLLMVMIVIALAILMMTLLPENTQMLIETVQAYLASRGI